MKIEVTTNATVFEHYDDTQVEDKIVDAAAEKIVEQMRDKIESRVSSILETQATEILSDIIKGIVDGPIALTNSYGESTGKTTTIRGMIVDKMSQMMKPGDRYTSGTGVVDKLIQECVAQFLSKEMVNELTGVKTQLKAVLNNAVIGNLQKQVTDVIKGY